MKKLIPTVICLIGTFILISLSINHSKQWHINTYPNLPAPIGNEKVLITSAGQATESIIIQSIARQLHLDADFRPRALASDLYDYHTIVMTLGYSTNGLKQTTRQFKDEQLRVERIIATATIKHIPIILIDLSGKHRDYRKTNTLFNKTVNHADYYIGLKNGDPKKVQQLLTTLKTHHIPATFVHELDEIAVPFNSVFR